MTVDLLQEDPKLRAHVQRGMDLLAERLDPIIATRLEPQLGGLAWTEILHQLDAMKGRAPRAHSAADLQAQLRMLTERLGGLGHPFDDERRNVSRLGSELRLARNTLAHGGAFAPDEAWRVHDTASRLLLALGDDDGAAQCLAQRDLVAPLLPGGASATRSVDLPVEAPPVVEAPRARPMHASESASETGVPQQAGPGPAQIAPDAEVYERSGAVPVPTIGQSRMEFEAWEVSVVGTPVVLDTLRRIESKEQVRALAAEIVDFEGPIHVDRLTGLVAQSFGVGKLHAKRQKAILRQLSQCGFTIDADGFAWPEALDPASWTEFRPSSDPDRRFLHVSPVELANAASFLRARHPGESPRDRDRRVLRTFGRQRLTKAFSAHLARANV